MTRSMAAGAFWTACLALQLAPGAAAAPATPPASSVPVFPDVPPPAPGIIDLKFSEIYEPIGDGGLRYSGKALSLDGRKVRILGYMVERDLPVPGMLLLAPLAARLHERESGQADDLPAATLFVILPGRTRETVRHTPGLLLLTGTLQLGNRVEADGRISSVRLLLDAPPAVQGGTSR